MHYDDGAGETDLDEWMRRVTPFLEADDPHQRCVARQRELGGTVEQHCTCPKQHPDDCDKACCRPNYVDDEWSWPR